ncbi:MAG TPA: VWA domain-containing protein [Candidatus Sulfotelmatobacter sp.]
MSRTLSRFFLAILVLSWLSSATLTAAAQSRLASKQDASPVPDQAPAATISAPTPAPVSGGDAQEPSVTIRQTVRRVIVDVTVRDANGKPVHGLSANDFSITEDKQPQHLLSFDVYDLNKPSISRGPNAAPLPPNVFENIPAAPERGPLYVILFDMVNMDTADEITSRQQLLKFINSKPAGTRFAIFVTSDQLRLVQGFTDDRGLLTATLDGKHPRAHVPRMFLYGGNYGRGNPYTAVDMLTHVGEYLDGIPGRKNLLWLSGGFALNLFAREADDSELRDAVIAAINALAQAQVAVYPVDVSGVQLDISAAFNNDYRSEDAIAAMTGGRAFYSTNEVSSALVEATEDGGNYYTLTYSPSDQEDDGKCHKISVKLDQQHDQLSYRQQYCRAPLVSAANVDEDGANSNPAGAPALAVPLQAGDLLQGNIRPGAPMLHDLVFSAHMYTDRPALATSAQMAQLETQAAFYRTQSRNRPLKPLPPVKIQTYTIDYRVLDPEPVLNGKPRTLEFAVAAFDEDGKVLNGIVNDGMQDATSQASDNKAGLFRMRQTLVVPVSAKSLRVGVRDRMNDRMGTLEVPLPLSAESVAKK